MPIIGLTVTWVLKYDKTIPLFLVRVIRNEITPSIQFKFAPSNVFFSKNLAVVDINQPQFFQ